MIIRHLRPITAVLQVVDRGGRPDSKHVSRAIVRALNLPFFSFLRVTLFHGPMATVGAALGLVIANRVAEGGFAPWQIVGPGPDHLPLRLPDPRDLRVLRHRQEGHPAGRAAVGVLRAGRARRPAPHHLDPAAQQAALPVDLRRLAAAALLRGLASSSRSIACWSSQGFTGRIAEMMPLVHVDRSASSLVCMLGALAMSVLTASEVSRSAARLSRRCARSRAGSSTTTCSSTSSHRRVRRPLPRLQPDARPRCARRSASWQLTHDLAGELKLEVLIVAHHAGHHRAARRRPLHALRLRPRRPTSCSRVYAAGLETREIRIPPTAGIAGAVFTTRQVENIADPYADPRFNQEVDRRTGYRTESILCMPIVNKAGARIGVTQVLNKRGGALHRQGRVAAARVHGADRGQPRERQALRRRPER